MLPFKKLKKVIKVTFLSFLSFLLTLFQQLKVQFKQKPKVNFLSNKKQNKKKHKNNQFLSIWLVNYFVSTL